MSDTLNRILQIGLWLLLGASLVLFTIFYINGEDKTDLVLWWGQVLLIVTAALLIIFPIIQFIRDPKAALRFLIVLVIFGALFFVSWLIAQGNTGGDIYETEGITANLSRLIGSGIIMVYILAGIAVLSIVITAIVNAFK